MHKVLGNCLVKLAQRKSVVWLTIAIHWDVKPKTIQTLNLQANSEKYVPSHFMCVFEYMNYHGTT